MARVSQIAELEDENCQLLLKYNERLDKLIAAETTIRDLSEQMANLEREKFETKHRQEQSRCMVVELPPLDDDGQISFRNTGTIQELIKPLESNRKNRDEQDFNVLKSELYDMVSDVRDQWKCSEGMKRKLDKLIKDMVVSSETYNITELIK